MIALEKKYANIIIDIAHEKLDRPFQYGIPMELRDTIHVGMEVDIPFGKGNHVRHGYIIEITDICEYDPDKIKDLIGITSKKMSVESKLIQVAHFIKERYGAPMIASLRTVLPVKKQIQEIQKRTVTLAVTKEYGETLLAEYFSKHQVARARLLAMLMDEIIMDYQELQKKCKVTKSTFDALVDQRVITITESTQYRKPIQVSTEEDIAVVLSEEQRRIVDEVEPNEKYLIHGITGSGKTEVYLRLIEKVIKEKKQAIVLIPEIALTYQTATRFYNRFGDRVSILNSKLSHGERYDQMQRAIHGDIDVVIGPRSALFTPFPNLGLIIIDEEHESSYKSEQIPRYHAREVAYYYASLHGASVVLGSATPSIETYHEVMQGNIHLFELTKRLTGSSLPEVYIADMRAELRDGNRSMFSRTLEELIRDRLAKKEQIMLFLNRRGISGFTSCRSCGYVVKCPHCDITLSKHENGKMMCHYCGYTEPVTDKCPSCGSPFLLEFKSGTQQVVEHLQRILPDAKVMRMDSDTTSGKHEYETLLQEFRDHKADILVGTQMIIKGHDFKNVTLVGVVAADISLGANDYLAGERTFQLLTQAAGRAGRGSQAGEVVIQTYQPDHYSIQYAKNHDFKGFYKEEIAYRELMEYPPVQQLMGILVLSKEEERGDELSKEIGALLRECFTPKEIKVIGPTSARLKKIKDVYRYTLYVKATHYDMFTKVKETIETKVVINGNKEAIQYDYSPVGGY